MIGITLQKYRKRPLNLLLGLMLLTTLPACAGTDPQLNADARARFDEILTAMPELDSITCLDDDCTSVVYFNFNKEPQEGFDFILRGNTATFSNWKLTQTGSSHITIFGTLNGQTIMQCNGSNGAVDSCS